MGVTPYVHAIVCVIEGIRRQKTQSSWTCRLCNVIIQGVIKTPICYVARVRDARERYCEIASGLSEVSDS